MLKKQPHAFRVTTRSGSESFFACESKEEQEKVRRRAPSALVSAAGRHGRYAIVSERVCGPAVPPRAVVVGHPHRVI